MSHCYTSPQVINKHGLVYTVPGSDEDLKPILLTAHQDIVPVDDETLDEWTYPPFEGHYDQRTGYLYGRGTADDKSALTGLMSALEALLAQEDYDPRRTVILAFGFDHEISGERGAGEIAKHLLKKYGEDGIAFILDEGGSGLQQVDNTLYALPAVYEKGYLDVGSILICLVVTTRRHRRIVLLALCPRLSQRLRTILSMLGLVGTVLSIKV